MIKVYRENLRIGILKHLKGKINFLFINSRYICGNFVLLSLVFTFRHLSFRLPAEAGLSEADSLLDWGNILSPFSLAATKKTFL